MKHSFDELSSTLGLNVARVSQLPSSLELSHVPVMMNEILKITTPANGGSFVDCTFGGGNYSKEILKYSSTKVLAIDRDENVISIAEKLKRRFPNRFKFYRVKFSELDTIIYKKVENTI